ncbi:tetratricopeptide repeat protein [Salinifilum ghardaiensis]
MADADVAEGAADRDRSSGMPQMSARARQTPEEWRQTARELESEIDAYPEDHAEILGEAAHAWQRAGDLDRAEQCYERLLAEQDDPHMPDPRVPYAEFLIEAELDPDRGWGMLRQLWHERTTDPQDYQRAAEIHEELGFLQEALTWSNAGVARCCPQPFDPGFADLREDVELFTLLDGRRRQRRALEQPADELDELVEASRGDVAESLAPRPQQDTPPLVPYWPEGEFDEALRRWPETLRPVTPHGQDEDAPRTHTEHRRAVERELRASAAGRRRGWCR